MRKTLCLLLVFTLFLATSCAGTVGNNESKEISADNASYAESVDNADKIIVPDVLGMTPDDAKELLEYTGFTVKIKSKPFDEVPEGEIAGTDLTVGDSYEKGTRIWVYVSSGKSLATSALEYKQSALIENRPKLEQGANSDYQPINYEFMRACWISQYDTDGVYGTSGLQRNEAEFRDNMKNMFAKLIERGINTVIVQLRPNGDSFYPSAYYCPSNYVTGSYAIDFTYDPLAIMVEEAHAVGLSFHGWINPLRCMEKSALIGINISYGIRNFEQNHMGDYLVEYGNRLYLNPGREEVRQLIIDGAVEIVRYYDVDGIHIDDYFYPTRDSVFDRQSFMEQDEYKDIAAFRRGSLNKLVSGIYSAVKAENHDVLFGVSPAGNIANVRAAYADVDTWLSEEGYLDYIMPQFYYGMQNGKFSYDTLYDNWSVLIELDSIRMIPGMTLSYAVKGYAGEATFEWNNSDDILKTCLQYSYKFGNCSGFSLFSLASMMSPIGCEHSVATKGELDNLFEFAMIIPSDRID